MERKVGSGLCGAPPSGAAPRPGHEEGHEEKLPQRVIPGRAKREPGIHNHDREYGFRACAKRRIPDVQSHIGE